MKFITSYGVAFVLILLVGGWLVTGTIIQGGNGPGEGEKSIIGLFTGDKDKEAGVSGSGASATNGDKDKEAGVSGSGSLRGVNARENVATNGDKDKLKLQSVRTVLFEAQQMPIEVSLRGRTEASATISINAQTSGLIESVSVKKGQSVEVGDLICTVDQGVRKTQVAQAQASLAQAKAALKQAEDDFETNKELREKGLSPANSGRSYEVQLQAAIASLASATSALDSSELELSRTMVRAEVAGIIQEPLANAGDMLSAGNARCATLVQLDPMLFVGMVVEAKVGLLQEGLKAVVTTVTGQQVEGEVSYIASISDAETRSFTVEIEIANPKSLIRSGLTANAEIAIGSSQAHLIPQSSLTLDSEGEIGVKLVNGDIVQFASVTSIKDSLNGIWVIGLPSTAEIIIFGQEYVFGGQQVAVTRVEKGEVK